MIDHRQYAPATVRNRDFILDVLRDVLPTTGIVLEIASGSGEHVVHFARNFPSLAFQPSDPEPDALRSIAAWVKAAQVTNVRAPIVLDASQSPWPIASADGNHLHQHGPHLALRCDARIDQGCGCDTPSRVTVLSLWPVQTPRVRNGPEQPSVRPEPSRSQPDLGSAKPRSGGGGGAIRRILGSDYH